MAALTVAVDFDGVLVHDGRWLPGAADAIRFTDWPAALHALDVYRACPA